MTSLMKDWSLNPPFPPDWLGPMADNGVDAGEEDMSPFEAIILPLRDMVIYPMMVTPMYVARYASQQALEEAQRDNWPLVAVAQKVPVGEDRYPTADELYSVGTEIAILRQMRMPDGSMTAVAQGLGRVRITSIVQEEPFIVAVVEPLEEKEEPTPLAEALMRAVLGMFEKVVNLNQSLPDEAYVYAMNLSSPGALADFVAQVLKLSLEQHQDLLETLSAVDRLQKLSAHLARELDVLELEDQIHARVQQEVDKTQREYFLREQLRTIQNELGESDLAMRDLRQLQELIEKADLPDHVRERANEELARLTMMSPMAPEYSILRSYLDWLLELPWTQTTEDNLDLKHAEEVLESRHYGLPKAKERILEYIAVRKLAPEKTRSTILCFVGPPGTGKTSLGRSIAEALGREFVRVSLGGVRDEAEIRGHRRTYIGALPGRILQTMRRAGTVNPVFMLDELDKLGQDFRGDPAAALLEVLDPEQNHAFSDHYLEIPYDLSQVLFIATANVVDTIPPALEDRLEIIEFPGYTEEEKLFIARKFLVPRQIELNGLQEQPPRFPDAVISKLIREYTYEAGVRNLEREIGSLCRKAARRLAEGKKPLRMISVATVEKFLGPPPHLRDELEQRDEVGVAQGLAWTPNGGELLPVEVALMPGKGQLTLTGQLGEVMQESAQAAFTYLRSHAEQWGLEPKVFEETDIHIHLPEGAIPKDGPSAGVTLATALISAFTRRPVRHTVAMTGEVTLRGRVLPVGGLKEKLLTARRAGVKKVLLPARNRKDLSDIPRQILRGLEIVLVERMDEVLAHALVEEEDNGVA